MANDAGSRAREDSLASAPGQRKRRPHGRTNISISRASTRILMGEEDLSKWSDAELERGRRKAKDGTFRGPPAKVVPAAIHNELVRRKMRKAYRLLQTSTPKAVAVLLEIAEDKGADPAVRVKAASEILDRVLGKAPQTVSLDIGVEGPESPWTKMVRNAVVGSLQQAQELMNGNPDVVDGEVVEEE